VAQPATDKYERELAVKTLMPFYERYYAYSVGRMDALNSRLGFPAAVLTLVFGVLAFLAGGLPELSTAGVYITFYVLIGLLLGSTALTFWFLALTMIGYKGFLVGKLGDIDATVVALGKRNADYPSAPPRDIEHELAIYLLDRYRHAADRTVEQLHRKSSNYRRATVCLYLTVLFLLLSIVPYSIINYRDAACVRANATQAEVEANAPRREEARAPDVEAGVNRESESVPGDVPVQPGR